MEKTTPIASNSTWENRAELAIAHGALTNSKRPTCFVRGVYPTHLTKGRGCVVWDTNGKRYIDFICALGTNLLGYAHEEIGRAVYDQFMKGAVLSLGTDTEVLAAERVKELFPFIERLRFLKTGSDACVAALRIARTATGRDWVYSEGYHGFHDEFVALTPPALGIPKQEHGHVRPLANLDDITEAVAAVIVEPIITDNSEKRIEWLRDLRRRCTQTGTVLIFDEIITGFRTPKYSVSAMYGIEPDLICLGKAMGNGMPISVVGGKQSIMEAGEYFISSTFAGDTTALAASLATMNLLQKKYNVDFLWEKGAIFQREFNRMWPEKLTISGYPTRGVFKGDDMVKALFFQEACKAGILLGSSFFFNFPHIEVMDEVLSAFRGIMTRIKTGSVELEGEMPRTPFAQRMRQ
jgi:glutamate-1-semialdehyde 2,1-aminomutase